mmetsp:Transcript_102807/g.331704  ORF Transcript_102807/g.331704 Transcript_102807/m.331704 type:complete len:237 (-) Transcript_102807:832-1542(-)
MWAPLWRHWMMMAPTPCPSRSSWTSLIEVRRHSAVAPRWITASALKRQAPVAEVRRCRRAWAAPGVVPVLAASLCKQVLAALGAVPVGMALRRKRASAAPWMALLAGVALGGAAAFPGSQQAVEAVLRQSPSKEPFGVPRLHSHRRLALKRSSHRRLRATQMEAWHCCGAAWAAVLPCQAMSLAMLSCFTAVVRARSTWVTCTRTSRQRFITASSHPSAGPRLRPQRQCQRSSGRG